MCTHLIQVPTRDPKLTYDALRYAQLQMTELAQGGGAASEASIRRTLDAVGMTEEAVSACPRRISTSLTPFAECPLWLLDAIRDHLFEHLGLCWLHIEVEGNLKHVISAIVLNLSEEKRQGTLAHADLHSQSASTQHETLCAAPHLPRPANLRHRSHA